MAKVKQTRARPAPVDLVPAVDWPALIRRLGRSDQALADELTERGIPVGRSTITELRNGTSRDPKYRLGRALEALELEGRPEGGL